VQFAFEERNEDASKALNASSFDHKKQAFAVWFLRKDIISLPFLTNGANSVPKILT
jgi:hypothetical protein